MFTTSSTRSRSASPMEEGMDHSHTHEEDDQNNISVDTENTKYSFKKFLKKKDTSIMIEKIPIFWNIIIAQTFIQNITKNKIILQGIKSITMLKHTQPDVTVEYRCGGCFVKFHTAILCKKAYDEWITTTTPEQCVITMCTFQVRKLYANIKPGKKTHEPSSPFPTNQPLAKKIKHIPTKAYKTYGLDEELLKSLHIKLPLNRKVYVGNLTPNVDEEKLREVFSLAGQVLQVSVKTTERQDKKKTFGKVEFDHPVEAVQAISMFHHKNLYNSKMIVHMDFNRNSDVPTGLSEIGPGLGFRGKPLRGVRNHIELEPLKELLKAKDVRTLDNNATKTQTYTKGSNSYVKQNKPAQQTYSPSRSPMKVQEPVTTQTPITPPAQNQMQMVQAPTQQIMNPFGTPAAMMDPVSFAQQQILQTMLQNFSQQNTASFQQAVNLPLANMNVTAPGQSSNSGGTAFLNWQAQSTVNTPKYSGVENYYNAFGYNQNNDNSQRNLNKANYDDRESRQSSRDKDNLNNHESKNNMLIFNNLPQSVSLQTLKNKMQEVGEFQIVKMMGQGRAIVRFVDAKHADLCIKIFNKSKVDGQIVDVKYF